MKRSAFILALLIGVGACKSDIEPEPEVKEDLTGVLVGTYYNIQNVNQNGIPIEFLVRWTISKINNDHIRIDQYAATNFVKPEGYQGPYDPDNPVQSVIDNVKLTETEKFFIDRDVEWHYNGSIQKAKMVIDAKKVGMGLDVTTRETIAGNTKEENFMMAWKWSGVGRVNSDNSH